MTDHPEQGPPERSESTSPLVAAAAPDCPRRAALCAAAEQMVFRALERAGNRLKTQLNGARPPGVSAAELYLFVPCGTGTAERLLTDAWSQVPRFADGYGCCADDLTAALDAYCRVLLTQCKPHDPELLNTYLAQVSLP